MSQSQRIAVVGGGHLGTIHARLVQQVENAELVVIVEPSTARARELADEFPCPIETDFERFLSDNSVDGVVLAAPTSLHHPLGMRLLEQGIHCLIEKPLAPTTDECEDLVRAARENSCVLQVGHVERFNPVWTTFEDRLCEFGNLGAPQFIQATREGTLTFRSMDAGVVLDLMIHDIDLVLSIVDSPIVSVQSLGFHWTGSAEDVAQARVAFANGCVAQFSASRVATQPRRHMRIYGRDWCGEVDFADRKCTVLNGPTQKTWQTRQYSVSERRELMDALFEQVLTKEELTVRDANPILDELTDFAIAIRENGAPRVTGDEGLAAVDLAQQVIQRIEARTPSRQRQVPIYRRPSRKAG